MAHVTDVNRRLSMRPLFHLAAAAAILAVAGCGATVVSTATIDRARMPQTAGGTPVLSPEGAIGYAAYTLGTTGNGPTVPANTALALGAVDFLAGDFYTNPRWTSIPAQDKIRMLQGRGELRRALAIAPGATSQQVVDGLIAASAAYGAQDPAGVSAALPRSVFTLGPDGTTRVLSNLPYLVSANVASQNASAFINSNCINGTGAGCS